MKTIKILLGGSPCTHWSIAQSQNRETAPSGAGWELFRNYLIAKEKFKPDYFLYENNKSAAEPIKAQIRRELGVWSGLPLIDADNGIRFTYINSARVSAQNRERFYVTNFGEIAQPEDRGILLKDVLDSAGAFNEKSYALTAAYGGAVAYNTFERRQRTMCAERVATVESGAVSASDSKQYRVYGTGAKSVTLCGEGGGMGAKTGLYAIDYTGGGYEIAIGKNGIRCVQKGGGTVQGYTVAFTDTKCPTLMAEHAARPKIIEQYVQCPINASGGKSRTSQAHYANANGRNFYPQNPYAETVVVCGAALRSRGGVKAPKPRADGKANAITTARTDSMALETGCGKPVYTVENGRITIKGRQFPIRLPDGNYIIRKLTVAECRRLQTVPDWYAMPVSDTQAYRMLGNGWTVEVIKHILRGIPEIAGGGGVEADVLSMYDGMSCGQIALRELGVKIKRYVSYEIDKYAIAVTQANFPPTEQRGNAFSVRDADWRV